MPVSEPQAALLSTHQPATEQAAVSPAQLGSRHVSAFIQSLACVRSPARCRPVKAQLADVAGGPAPIVPHDAGPPLLFLLTVPILCRPALLIYSFRKALCAASQAPESQGRA
ncbi:hypothetical protein NDU88_000881 [Pleurodeles waltl]|uniref:Uncharacterized protein n=1 Tax=Pleurodeles waltl TaxID=8319 RepID=A0AAV7MNA8_PLEWA|nr:hypothetical protein NDU88_000881 [Pleurodeles waltl]